MAEVNITYGANTAIAMDVSSLASSPTNVVGRESTQVLNAVTLFQDAVVNCNGIATHATVAPLLGDRINLYLWGANVTLATAPIDDLDGADATRTLTHVQVLDHLKLVDSAVCTVATAALTYYFRPFSVFDKLGGMPKFWGLYLSHNMGATLAAAQATMFSFNGITAT